MADTSFTPQNGSEPLLTIAIIGAGITGLITAHGLKKVIRQGLLQTFF